jgi:hypothetical protein
MPEAVTVAQDLAAELLSRPPAKPPARSESAEIATPIGFPRMANPAPFLTAAGFVTAPEETLSDGEPEPDDNPIHAALAAGAPLLENAGFVEKATAVLMNGDLQAIGTLIGMATQKRGSP